MTDPIDHAALLRKYMELVRHWEGTTFLEHIEFQLFTDAEHLELQRIAKSVEE